MKLENLIKKLKKNLYKNNSKRKKKGPRQLGLGAQHA
jgi:hypothetical protein